MINIEQITARLAKLPDQALQQYAMMHKEDPYIMALAVSESNRRKQIRAAGQVQAQEQPKVADQALMDMAPQQSPDEAGIAGLAAGDMNFADGGIVEHYQVGGSTYETPYDRMTRLNREREAALRAERLARVEAAGGNTTPYGEQMANVGRFIDQYVPDPRDLFKTLVSAPGYGLNKDLAPAAKAEAPAAPAGPTGQTQLSPQQIEAAVARPKLEANAGLGGTKEAAAMRGAKPTGTTPAAPAAAAPSIADAKTLAGQFLDTKAAEDVFKKFATDEEAAIAKQRAEFNKDKPQGKAYSKYEEMLSKEEAGAGKEKDEALGLAIFKAGLGMMAGSSPHAFENIGKGAMAGLDDYSSAMKDMKKAARERQKAMADIDNARRAEERDDWKTSREFENKASERLSKARELGVRGIMDITGKSAEIASGIYKTQVTEGGQDRRAKLQADTTLAAAKIRGDASGAAGGDKQQLAQLKALQSHYADQIKTTYNKADRARLQTKLDAVESAIAKMAGLDTILSAPGASSPGGTRPPLSSFQR